MALAVRGALLTGLTACEVAEPPDVPTPVLTGAGHEACAPAEAVDFTWSLQPVPEDSSLDVACVLGELVADADGLGLAMECAESEGPRARTLWVQATPKLPTAAVRAGMAVRLWALAGTDEAGGEASFVRLETAKGGLLIAAGRAGTLLAPDGGDPWLPFTITPAASTCLSEETACGSQGRAALDVRRAGGAPRIAQDASFAAVGDRGEAQLWVSAAVHGDAACVGPTGAWYSLGLMATR